MLQYDGDLDLPKNYLVNPPEIHNTLSELLVKNSVKQYAISETQKYGHVTYFWNGNRSEKFSNELEIFEQVDSDNVPFEQRPWMKSAEITDKLVEAIQSGKYGFLRANFPNGDMVGHSGDFNATKIAVEAVDLCIKRILKAVDDVNGVLLITADHGNADEMYYKSKDNVDPKVKTSHTLNPVPFIVYDNKDKYEINQGSFGLANVAPTIAMLLGLEIPSVWEDSILRKN